MNAMDSLDAIKRNIELLMFDLEREVFEHNDVRIGTQYPVPRFDRFWSSLDAISASITPVQVPRSGESVSLNEELGKLREELKKSKEQEMILRKHLADVQKQMEHDALKIIELQEVVEKTKKAHMSLEQNNKETLAEAAFLKKQLSESQARGNSLTKALEEKSLAISELQHDIACLRELEQQTLNAYRADMGDKGDHREQVEQKSQKVDVNKLTVSTSQFLEKAMADYDEQTNGMFNKIRTLLRDKRTLQKALRCIKRQGTEMVSNDEARNNSITDLREKLADQEKVIAEKENIILNLVRQRQELYSKNDAGSLPAVEKLPAETMNGCTEHDKTHNYKIGSDDIFKRFFLWLKQPIIKIREERDEDE